MLAFLILMGSCASNKQSLPYFEKLTATSGTLPGNSDYNVRIIPADELLITVNSSDPRATAAYNLPLTNYTASRPSTSKEGISFDYTVSQNQQIQTYIVDNKGDITMPVLGVVHVAGMTVEELREYLVKRISESVKDPIVKVSLVNFRVNVMGEVKEPQTIVVKSERFTILEALASAGDMTEYGNRDNVLVIREMPDGTKSYARLDFHDPSFVDSPYFYLQQNDVVYVEPNDVRKAISRYDQNKSYRVQVVSTIVSALSVIASLVISLTIK